MAQKAKDAGELAKWAAQRREERDAEKAKRVEAFKLKALPTAAAPAPAAVKPPVPRTTDTTEPSDAAVQGNGSICTLHAFHREQVLCYVGNCLVSGSFGGVPSVTMAPSFRGSVSHFESQSITCRVIDWEFKHQMML